MQNPDELFGGSASDGNKTSGRGSRCKAHPLGLPMVEFCNSFQPFPGQITFASFRKYLFQLLECNEIHFYAYIKFCKQKSLLSTALQWWRELSCDLHIPQDVRAAPFSCETVSTANICCYKQWQLTHSVQHKYLSDVLSCGLPYPSVLDRYQVYILELLHQAQLNYHPGISIKPLSTFKIKQCSDTISNPTSPVVESVKAENH